VAVAGADAMKVEWESSSLVLLCVKAIGHGR
jgi:hypothetical protein